MKNKLHYLVYMLGIVWIQKLSAHFTVLFRLKLKSVKVFNFIVCAHKFMIRNILKRREESDSYLTRVCRHHWSRKSLVKIEEISGAFS